MLSNIVGLNVFVFCPIFTFAYPEVLLFAVKAPAAYKVIIGRVEFTVNAVSKKEVRIFLGDRAVIYYAARQIFHFWMVGVI